MAKVQEHIDDAVAKGARVLLGGKLHALGGSFFEPTTLVDVTHHALASKDETFGPQ
jgi:succinate-semialdehyde dehydrogenase/glutarate-semialdehyde dehydrogenase